MITVFCVNNRGQRFEKVFDSPYQARIFILRCRHGHRVYILGFLSESQEATAELSYMF